MPLVLAIPDGYEPGTGLTQQYIASGTGTGGTAYSITAFGTWTGGVDGTATLAAAFASGESAITFPPGPAVLITPSVLSMPANLNLLGAGAGGTTLLMNPSGLTAGNSYSFFTTRGNNFISGITFDGNRAAVTATGFSGQIGFAGIYAGSGVTDVTVQNCIFQHIYNSTFSNSGESFGVQFSGGSQRCAIYNSRFTDICGTGWNIGASTLYGSNPALAGYHKVIGCTSYLNGWQGGSFYLSQYGVMANNVVYGNGKRGLNMEWCDGLLVIGNHIQGNAYEAIGTYGVCTNIKWDSNVCMYNNTAGGSYQAELGIAIGGTVNGSVGIAQGVEITNNLVVPNAGGAHLHVDLATGATGQRGTASNIVVSGPTVDSWTYTRNTSPFAATNQPTGVIIKPPTLQSQLSLGAYTTWTAGSVTLSNLPANSGAQGYNGRTVTTPSNTGGSITSASVIPAGSRVRVHYRIKIQDQNSQWQVQCLSTSPYVVNQLVLLGTGNVTDVGTWQEGDFISYTGSNAGAIRFCTNGTVTGVSAPLIDFITVSQCDYLDSLTVTASTTPNSIYLTPSSAYLTPTSTTVQMTPVVQDARGNQLTGYTVTYASSNTAVATVNSSTGLVTYAGTGSCNITGTVTGYTGISNTPCSITAYTPAATTVTVTPATFTATVGGLTVTLTGAVYDQHSALIAGDTPTWASSNNAIATVSSGGVVTAVAAGSVTITASYSGATSGTSAGTISAAAYATHEPTGMTAVVNTGAMTTTPATQGTNGGGTGTTWSSGGTIPLTFTNYGPATVNSNGTWAGNLSTVPSGTGLRVTYTTAVQGGYAPVTFGGSWSTTGTGTIYTRRLVRFSSNWNSSTAIGIKIDQVKQSNGPSNNHITVTNCYPNATSLWVEKLLQFGTSGYSANVPGTALGQALSNPTAIYTNGQTGNIGDTNLGNWHQIEEVMVPESPAGQSPGNGAYTLYVDGVQVYTTVGQTPGATNSGVPSGGVRYNETGQTPGWNFYQVTPYFGGDVSSDHPPTTMTMDIDQLYISVK